jgi:hypothetical protein
MIGYSKEFRQLYIMEARVQLPSASSQDVRL